jgi:hypothetical protein
MGSAGLQEVWAQSENRPELRGRKKRKRKRVFYFEKQQTNEFKCKFEFEHTKPMHQHVCNIKLLGLIYFILKINKCLK